MSDYAVTIKVRNGPMVRAMRAAGMETAAALAEASNVGPTRVGEYLSLTLTPYRQDGTVRACAARISFALGVPIELLFPEQHLHAPLRKNRAEMFMSIEDVDALCGAERNDAELLDADLDRKTAISMALQSLSDRQRMVIVRRYGLNGEGEETLEEIAKDMGVTRERIRQIELKAHRVMRKALPPGLGLD